MLYILKIQSVDLFVSFLELNRCACFIEMKDKPENKMHCSVFSPLCEI